MIVQNPKNPEEWESTAGSADEAGEVVQNPGSPVPVYNLGQPLKAQKGPNASDFLLANLMGALADKGRSQVPLSEKIYLTLKEAVQYTGLTRSMLLRAIKSGELKAIKDGGWKIRRSRLEKL